MTAHTSANDDEQRRAAYLTEVTGLLFPSGTGAGREHSLNFMAIPNMRKPRVLIPDGSRRIAAAALRRYTRPAQRISRWKRDAAVAAIHARADRMLLPDRVTVTRHGDDIVKYFSDIFDQQVHICIHIGPSRANRKPIIQLLADDATSIGFAKIGINGLTNQLVETETDALFRLNRTQLPGIRIPEVTHIGTWNNNTVLIQEPLPAWERPTATNPARLHAAMLCLAQCTGLMTTSLEDSQYADDLRRRLKEIADHDNEQTTALVNAGRRLLDIHAHRYLTFGAWHGDWSPWNMAMRNDDILLWDFERFTTGVPMGYDMAHYTMQRDIISRNIDPTDAVRSLITDAPALLAEFGVDTARARVTTLLYLVDLATRYLFDGQAEAGAKLGALGTWLLPVLLRHIAGEETRQ